MQILRPLHFGDENGNCIFCHINKAVHKRLQNYCSWACIDADIKHISEIHHGPCQGCGKLIVRIDQRKYCSEECHRKSVIARVSITLAVYRLVYKRDDYLCQYCGDRAEHLDHIVPYSKGGDNSATNLVAACATCNFIAFDRQFLNFEEKKKWILKVRGIKQIHRTKDLKRPDWHAKVYGAQRGRD